MRCVWFARCCRVLAHCIFCPHSMEKMKLNDELRSDHARYRFGVSSISATCSASGSWLARRNNVATGGVRGQLLRSGVHPGDSGCRRTSCTPLDTLLAEGIEGRAYDAAKGWILRGLLELGRSYGLDGEVFPEDPIGFLEGLPVVHVAPIISVSCNFP